MTACNKLFSMTLLGASLIIAGCEGGAAPQAPAPSGAASGDQGSTSTDNQGSTTSSEGHGESDGKSGGSSSK